MLQRLLDTESLTGGQWGVVLLLSLVAPTIVGVDKAIQLARQRKAQPLTSTPATARA
jgi:Ca2+-transporting ATPase